MLRIRAATPQRCSPLASTRTTDARQHTHLFSPPVISFGKIRTISSALPSLKCASLYKKIPLLLKSRVQPLASIVPCSDLIVTGRARLRRFCVRRSDLGSAMEEGEYHNSAPECIAAGRRVDLREPGACNKKLLSSLSRGAAKQFAADLLERELGRSLNAARA